MICTCRPHPQCSTPRCQELCWSVCDTKEMIHPALAQWTSVWTSRLDHTRCCQEPWMSRFVSDVVTKWQWNLLLESSQGWMIMTEWWDTTLVCCTPHDQCLWKYLTVSENISLATTIGTKSQSTSTWAAAQNTSWRIVAILYSDWLTQTLLCSDWSASSTLIGWLKLDWALIGWHKESVTTVSC